jgi:phage host-nuclease inhibitor protein Gam
MTSTMQRLTTSKPSVGPYCRARAQELAATDCISAAYDSAGNVEVSGSPPASDITSSRSVIAIRSRIAEDFITLVRSANSAA